MAPTSTSRVGTNATRMARSGAEARSTGWFVNDSNDGSVGVQAGIGVGCKGVGVDIGTGVSVGTGVGIFSRGKISSKVLYTTNSRRFGSAGPSVKVRTNWLPARITGRVK